MLEDRIAALEQALRELHDEREKVRAALFACERRHIQVYYAEADGVFRVVLRRNHAESTCSGRTLSGALFGALAAFGNRSDSP